ncbi:dTDP-4-dehydrorhamnose reductase [Faunimonas pinastri]|uniref:dTDP-4-dehydrorhamnose reductase n=1 Tax=Faunimonas pinastri TaxID=1855383 RepID=A0A1H9D5H7_9HYPH|nr:dTDP-4-dehydrorhamnose reductase [Faunimonas pinastri]SEQ08639.1 dTDP-4-dehydrorhamnose reductase [Faunimonas pinastri]
MTLRALVFGGGGQLGRELVVQARAGAIDLLSLGHADGDIVDPASIRQALDRHRPDVVVNAAAYTAVDRAESEPDKAFAINARAPGLLAVACAAANLPLIHVSTDYVFDGRKTGAYVEDDPIAPQTVYGRSKAEGESAVRAELHRHLILRTSWVYGAHGGNFLKTMLRLAGERDRLTVVADQHGCPTASIDLAQGILIAAERAASGDSVWGTYHLAGTGVTTWHGFACAIVEAAAPLTGRRPAVDAIDTAGFPTAAARPANSELDSGRFASVFGFRAVPWMERTGEVVRELCRTSRENNNEKPGVAGA